MLLLHNCLLDNCTIFITHFIVNMTWFTKRNIYKSTRRIQWLKLLCACNFNFTNWTIRESERKQIPSPSTELIRQSFLYNGLNFFFNQGQQEHSKFSGKSRSYTKGREKKVFFFPSVLGSSSGFILWPMNMSYEAYLESLAFVLGRRFCLFSSNHDHTRLQETMSMFYTSLKICLMFPSILSIPVTCLHM